MPGPIALRSQTIRSLNPLNEDVNMRCMILGIGAALMMVSGAAAQTPSDPRGALFVERGCARCHAISALGVKAKSEVAPDLTFAYMYIVNRHGVTLDAFFSNPGAVMHVMLAPPLNWTVAGRDSIAKVLEAIYNEHKAEYKPPGPLAMGMTSVPIGQQFPQSTRHDPRCPLPSLA